jgi:surface protein
MSIIRAYTSAVKKAYVRAVIPGSGLNLFAPSNLVAVVNSANQIDLTWTVNDTKQTGHRIYISTDNVTYTEKGTVSGLTAAYSATSLTEDQTYYFKVVAYKGTTESQPSNIVTMYCSIKFITTWDTEKAGSATKTIVIPTSGAGYDCYVDWGDGGAEENFTGTAPTISHVYAETGIKTVKIRGTFPRIYFNNTGDKLKIQTIKNWGNSTWKSFAYAFFGCANLTGTYTDIPNTSSCTNFTSTFAGCVKFNSPVLFNTANATTMRAMFYGCALFNQSVSTFNTAKVTSMREMFYGCSVFNQSVANFNTAKVTSMQSMFYGCFKFNQSVANFNTAAVTNMTNMFYYCSEFNQSVSNFNTALVTDMSSMFYRNGVFNQSVSNFDTAKVTNMKEMFYYCSSFNQSVSNFNTALVTDMSSMFYNCTIFNQSLASFNIESVTTMVDMMKGTAKYSSLNYDALLIAWGAQTPQTNVTFDIGDLGYTSGGAAEAGRTNLVNSYTWTINDGVPVFDNGKMVIAFDDGRDNQHDIIMPLCESEGVKCTIYVAGKIADMVKMKAMYDAGFDMQCHTYNHVHLPQLSQAEVETEMTLNNTAFTTNGMVTPNHHAYPFGDYNDDVITWISPYRQSARISSSGNVVKNIDKFRLKSTSLDALPLYELKNKIDLAKLRKTAVIFYGHEIGTTGYLSSEHFVELIQYGKSQGVDIITHSQLYDLLD